jgi:hypothetical protein
VARGNGAHGLGVVTGETEHALIRQAQPAGSPLDGPHHAFVQRGGGNPGDFGRINTDITTKCLDNLVI